MMKWAGIDFSQNRVLSEDNEAIEESEEYKLFNNKNVVLERWLNNILKRCHLKDPTVYDMWRTYILNLPQDKRELLFNLYRQHCNVIGATCSSITEKNYQAIEAGKDINRFSRMPSTSLLTLLFKMKHLRQHHQNYLCLLFMGKNQ